MCKVSFTFPVLQKLMEVIEKQTKLSNATNPDHFMFQNYTTLIHQMTWKKNF